MKLSQEREKPPGKFEKQTHPFLKRKKYPLYDSLKSSIKPTKEQ
jgi:hypothetical protein